MKIMALLLINMILLSLGGINYNSNNIEYTFTVEANTAINQIHLLGADTPINRSEIANYIKDLQTVDGGFRKDYGYPPRLNYTCLALLSLKYLGYEDIIDLDSAITFIADSQNSDGGFGNIRYQQDYDPSTLYYTYLAVYTLWKYGRLADIDVNAVKNYVLSLQNPDGTWGTTINTALALIILNIISGLGSIDKGTIINMLLEEPPIGVNYGGYGFLNTPNDDYPTLFSTWAGVKILELLNNLDLLSRNKILEMVNISQNHDGGFKSIAYEEMYSDIYSTFFATDIIAILGEQFIDVINAWKTAVYSLSVILTSNDLGEIAYSVFTMHNLINVIVPLAINVNATLVQEGDIVRVDVDARNPFMDPIKSADMIIKVNNKIFYGFENNTGKYYGFIDTVGFNNGTYTAQIEIDKTGYEPLKYSFKLSVIRLIFIKSLSVSKREARIGENISVVVEIVDRVGKAITGATVNMMLGEYKTKAKEISYGIYIANLSTIFPGRYNIVIDVEKQGYDSIEQTISVVMYPNIELEAKSIDYYQILLGILLIALSTITALPFAPSRKIILISILIAVLVPFYLLDYMLNMFELTIQYDIRFLLASLIILLLNVRGLKSLFEALSWITVLAFFIFFARVNGESVYILGSLMIIAGVIVYFVSPGEKDRVLVNLKRRLIYWITVVLAYSIGLAIVRNPYTLGGSLFGPPTGAGYTLEGYLSALWYIIYLFFPIMTAVEYSFLATQGLKINIEKLSKQLTRRE